MSNSRLYQAPAYAGGGMVPASNFGGMDWGGAMGGAAGLLGGLFGDSGAPYEEAMDQYKQWANKAQQAQNPFYNAGTGAIPQYQSWLQSQKDPSGFINQLMSQYQQSPWAKYQQQQAMRGGMNAASASGLVGSTPLMQQMQQTAAGISSQDMQNWLQNVLGINTQYGQGVGNMMTGGQNAANALTDMYGKFGQGMAETAYGKKAGENQDWSNMIGGGLQLGASLLGL